MGIRRRDFDFEPGTPVTVLVDISPTTGLTTPVFFSGRIIAETEIGVEKERDDKEKEIKVEEEEEFLVLALTSPTPPFAAGDIVFINFDHIVALTATDL